MSFTDSSCSGIAVSIGAKSVSNAGTGLLLASFAFHSLFALGAINADPHPGNYLFPGGDEVVFLDQSS